MVVCGENASYDSKLRILKRYKRLVVIFDIKSYLTVTQDNIENLSHSAGLVLSAAQQLCPSEQLLILN